MLKKVIRKLKYGQPVIIVSGLPRSGTSMMMKMLEAGGVPIMQDGIRTSDIDNPNGYYELERVKDLDKGGDKGWMAEARGKAVKVISFLLRDLPDGHAYKIIFMRRAIPEIIASQNKMLERRGETDGQADDATTQKLFESHLKKVNYLLKTKENFETLEIAYGQAIDNPREAATRIQAFLGLPLDIEKMSTVADKKLYRNREPNAVLK